MYLIIEPGHDPYLTKYYSYENTWREGMTVINVLNYTFSTDGETWKEVEVDHL